MVAMGVEHACRDLVCVMQPFMGCRASLLDASTIAMVTDIALKASVLVLQIGMVTLVIQS